MDLVDGTAGGLHARFVVLREALSEEIIAQAALVERLLVALLADGHLLVEGAPGLAKTMAVRALAAPLDADFARVQFTPDLLPADLTGTEIWRPQDGRFEFQAGPIFHPLLLADEINRAPAKVQSALAALNVPPVPPVSQSPVLSRSTATSTVLTALPPAVMAPQMSPVPGAQPASYVVFW